MPLRHSLLLFATLFVTCVGQDADRQSPPPTPVASSGSAWLGLSFSARKPDASSGARIPSLPPGIGFVVQAVSPGGPADLSQVHPKDVLWKFADQWLVNQGQLATLLNLKRPGDEITLAIFRDGKPAEIKVTLGEAPPNSRDVSRNVVEAAMLSDDGHPTRIITPENRTATFSDSDGKALVRRDGDGYQVVIRGPDKQVIFDGRLAADGNSDDIPADWRRRIYVLRRSLDHALDSRIEPVSAPRPRVVPPPTPSPGLTLPPAEPPKL
ncbi:MAG: PDZ domain-containing protein [Verrucomicrobia bacterium]|nr:MAG: PDZ domain-containing protein [Verrucomicrobiota bacterium]